MSINAVFVNDIVDCEDDQKTFDVHGVTRDQGRDVVYLDRPHSQLQMLLKSRVQLDVLLIASPRKWGPENPRVYVYQNQVVDYDWKRAYDVALMNLGSHIAAAAAAPPLPPPLPSHKPGHKEDAGKGYSMEDGEALRFTGVPFFLTYVPEHFQVPDSRLPDTALEDLESAKETNGWACAAMRTLPVNKSMEEEMMQMWKRIAAAEHETLEDKFGFRIIDGSAMSAARVDAHTMYLRSGRPDGLGAEAPVFDCTDWCLPGVPDSWLGLFQTLLLRELQSMRECVRLGQ